MKKSQQEDWKTSIMSEFSATGIILYSPGVSTDYALLSDYPPSAEQINNKESKVFILNIIFYIKNISFLFYSQNTHINEPNNLSSSEFEQSYWTSARYS